MTEKKLLDQILHDYPRFFTKDPSSNHVTYHGVVVEEYLQLKRAKYIVELAKDVRRPLKIWKNQGIANSYDIRFEVNLKDIKQVKLYTQFEDEPVVLLMDSGILDLGTDKYEDYFPGSCDEPIPVNRKYYIEVTDYNESDFTKGIPENDTKLNDKYDHDDALDIIGNNIDIPRRLYRDVTEDEYPLTYPPFCIDKTEPDYWYELRIIESMEDYKTLPLPIVVLKQYFGVTPTLVGRWRSVARMNSTLQGEKFMETRPKPPFPEIDPLDLVKHGWNSAVFDISVMADRIPKNLVYPTEDKLQTIVNRTFPLSKKAFLEYLLENEYGDENVILSDEYTMKDITVTLQLDDTEIDDSVTISDVLDEEGNVITGAEENLGEIIVKDSATISGNINSPGIDNTIISDSISGVQHDIIPISSLADFNLGTYLRTYYLSNYGVVLNEEPQTSGRLYAGNGVAVSLPRERCDAWVHPDFLGGVDDTGYASAEFTGLWGFTDWLKAYDFGINVPSDAYVTGVQIRIRWQVTTATSHRIQFRLYQPGGLYTIIDDRSTTYSSFSTSVYGDSYDQLSIYGLTPSDVNNMFIMMVFWGDNAPHQARVSYVTAQVWYYDISGLYTSKTITKSSGSTWKTFEVGPTENYAKWGCEYDILDGSTGTVLKHATPNINTGAVNLDISNLNNATLKCRAYLDNASLVPPTIKFKTDTVKKF